MSKHFVMLTYAVCLFYSVSAQQNPKQKISYYDIWITLNDSKTKFKGILYEVSDSSIMIYDNVFLPDYHAGTKELTEFSYSNIDMIKVRKFKSLARGTVIGACTGAGIGLSYGIGLYGEAIIMFAFAPAVLSMLPAAAFGAGAGALLGSVKDRIPIQSDIEHFKLYRGALQTYSIMPESAIGINQFKHKGFVGFSGGLVLPGGEDSGAGYGNTFLAGYRFTENWGIYISQFYSQYTKSSLWKESLLSIQGMTAGPLISIPINSKFRFDFKPGTGFSDASLWLEEVEEKSGTGIGFDFNTSLHIDFSKRVGMLAAAGYYSTSVKYADNDKDALRYIYLNLGYVYKFGRRSL